MDIKSLMVGDWVYDTLSQTDIKVNRGCFEINPLNGIGYEENLIPIPLTSEILEKNGFHEEWDEDIKLMVCDTIIVETGDNHKLYKDGKMYLRRVLAPLYYVHQLQHALRLCGIDKEIEL